MDIVQQRSDFFLLYQPTPIILVIANVETIGWWLSFHFKHATGMDSCFRHKSAGRIPFTLLTTFNEKGYVQFSSTFWIPC